MNSNKKDFIFLKKIAKNKKNEGCDFQPFN